MSSISIIPKVVYFGGDHLSFPHKGVVTHPLQSGFDMDLFLKRVYTYTIMTIGRWYINVLLCYISRQVGYLIKKVSASMVRNRAFYTNP